MDLRLLVPVTDAARVQEAPNTRAWPPDLAAQALRQPQIAAAWEGRDWSLLMQQARSAGLLARALDGLAGPEEPEGRTSLPAGVQAHHEAAQRLCRAQAAEIHREVRYIAAALAELKAPVVLLKGAAYVMAGLPAANGRIFSDIDFMVPKSHLAQAEAMLMAHGWMTTHHSAYDQRYYRQWMHEIPPLRHVQRNTYIDLHHTITPPTSRFAVDGARLLRQIVPIDGDKKIFVLAPVDMVLHSAVHLFTEGEFSAGLRDLLDLKDLLEHYSKQSNFWQSLFERSDDLGLQIPLFHALFHVQRLFGYTPPAQWSDQVRQLAPPAPARLMMGWLLGLALRPDHPSCNTRWTALARWLLYVRSHALRMPLYLAIPHLIRKAWMRNFPEKKNE